MVQMMRSCWTIMDSLRKQMLVIFLWLKIIICSRLTRQTIIDIAAIKNIICNEKNISISEFYNADEVFTSGTMGELTPVVEIDGRKIENKNGSKIREKIIQEYHQMTEKDSIEI